MRQKFSKKIFSDEDAFHMSTPEIIGEHISNQLAHYKTCAELCCAVGMLSVQLAKRMDKVFAIDIDEKRISDSRKNAELYGVAEKIKFIKGNVLDEHLLKKLTAEVVILDPDWSRKGMSKSLHVVSIDDTQPSLREMFNLAKKLISKNIVVRIPKTFNLSTISELGICKIENIIWDGEIKFKIAYFLEGINSSEEVDFVF
ncbi:MAG: methyltransferase domain-containing protein [Parcubacteria group bacterium]|jgi:trimethylguanosine synthase